jgi:hypothetical protein
MCKKSYSNSNSMKPPYSHRGVRRGNDAMVAVVKVMARSSPAINATDDLARTYLQLDAAADAAAERMIILLMILARLFGGIVPPLAADYVEKCRACQNANHCQYTCYFQLHNEVPIGENSQARPEWNERCAKEAILAGV